MPIEIRYNVMKKIALYMRKGLALCGVMLQAFYIIFRYGLYKDNTNPDNARHVQYFCQRLCRALGLNVHIHGEMPSHTALWVSNHISFLDIPVLGSMTRLFFLSKAEIANWFMVGFLARCGGTVFIQRGSGDTNQVATQMANYLKQDVPIVFFPEATTTNGEKIKRIYGKLFASALETQSPIQIAILCYVNPQGQLEKNIPFVDIGFVQHAKNVFDLEYKVDAHILLLPEVSVVGKDIKILTAEIQQKMEQGLAELQGKVLT